MIKRLTIVLLAILLSLSFLFSNSFSQEVVRPSSMDGWKEDILILLKAAKTPGDYKDLVDLIEVAPVLKEDPEIRRAYVVFAPKGMSPPEWAREEKIVTAETTEKVSPEGQAYGAGRRESEQVSEEEQRTRETEKRKKEKERREIEETGIEDYYRMGKKYYNSADYQKAIREFEKVLEINPLHKKAKKYLIKSHYEMGEKFHRNQAYRQAGIEFGKVLTLKPEHNKAKKYLNECQAMVEVKVAKEIPKEEKEVLLEIKPIEEGPPEKIGMVEEDRRKW